MDNFNIVLDKWQGLNASITEMLLKLFSERNVTEIDLKDNVKNELFESKFSIESIGVDMTQLGNKIGFGYEVIGLSYFYVKDTKGKKHTLRDFSLDDIIMIVATVKDNDEYLSGQKRYTSQTVHFEDETVLITDVCYFMKNKGITPSMDLNIDDYNLIEKNGWDRKNLTVQQAYEHLLSVKKYFELERKFQQGRKECNDMFLTNWGKSLDELGFSNYLSKDTIYGDWSCTVFEEGTNKKLGEFCADSGNVCVVPLKQVLDYNPEFADTLKDTPHIATVLEHFTGDITYKIEPINDNDYKVYLVGNGSINFRTEQTGC